MLLSGIEGSVSEGSSEAQDVKTEVATNAAVRRLIVFVLLLNIYPSQMFK